MIRADATCSKPCARDPDTAVLATVVWATGQLVDTSAVDVAGLVTPGRRNTRSASRRKPRAHSERFARVTRALRLARYLSTAARGPETAPVVAEALLSIGRHRERGDIAPIVHWSKSDDVELRWRAAWALFRPRDPAAIARAPRGEQGLVARRALLGHSGSHRSALRFVGRRSRRRATSAARDHREPTTTAA